MRLVIASLVAMTLFSINLNAQTVEGLVLRDTTKFDSCYIDEIPVFVYFDKNSSELYEDELIELKLFMFGLGTESRILITGSADTNTGTKYYNKRLAMRRAKAVKKFMNQNGFNNIKIRVVLDISENRIGSRSVLVLKEK